MNISLTILEWAVVAIGLLLILLDLWVPHDFKRTLSHGAAMLLVGLFAATFFMDVSVARHAFGQMYVMDGLALFFKRFFLLAAAGVLVMANDQFRGKREGGVEYSVLVLFALAGMMWAASANDFSMLFVSVELIAVSFYVLVSYLRHEMGSIEAGAKYLILAALASAFMVFGIALIFGGTGTLSFSQLAQTSGTNRLFQFGVAMVLIGLGFKLAAFPFQIWAPDVYQGAPTPTTAFLAVGSKAAGVVLLLRVLFGAAPQITQHWQTLLLVTSGITILYGNLCAIPQRNIKRLMGYSSIANAGYLLLGVAAMSGAGASAVLYYLAGYLFTLVAAFAVIGLVMRRLDRSADIGTFAGLHQRAPLLAAALTLAMVSLSGIPPLAGFFGKFLIIKAAVAHAMNDPLWMGLIVVALIGILVSFYYYLGVVRAIFWGKPSEEQATPIEVPVSLKWVLYAAMVGIFYLGIMPGRVLAWSQYAAQALNLPQ